MKHNKKLCKYKNKTPSEKFFQQWYASHDCVI